MVEARLRSRELKTQATDRSLTQKEEMGSLRKLRRSVFSVILKFLLSSSPLLERCMSFAALPSHILEQYHKLSEKRLWDSKHEHLDNEINRIKKENDNMQIELRHLKGDDITTLNYKELMVLEEALTNGISAIKTKQMELVRMMRKHMIEEENQNLQFKLLHLDPMDTGGNHVMESHSQGIYDHLAGVINYEACYSQMPPPPFAFRLQPMQPNLHDRF